MAKTETINVPTGQLAFPIRFTRRAFVIGSLLVVNNTAARLFVSKSNPNPAPGADLDVPAYTALPYHGWLADQINIGSDGTVPRITDSVTLQLSEDPAQSWPSVQIAQPNYYDKPNPTYLHVGGSQTIAAPQTTNFAVYTVPVNRKASIEQVWVFCARVAAASGPGNANANVSVVVPGTPGAKVVARAWNAVNTAGASGQAIASQCGIIGAGSQIFVNWSSVFPDQTDTFDGVVRVTEFDA